MNLVLLGPPGAGKGTQAARMAGEFGILHLSSGDILRAERKEKSVLGQQAQGFMDRGALVPDDLILTMMMDRIQRPEAARGFLLDGFPRTVVQGEALDVRLGVQNKKIDVVIDVEVDDAEVTRRLTGRWYCPADGQVYHEMFNPPSLAGTCNGCKGPLVRRKDDEPAVVQQRLRTYHEANEPLEKYYQARGILKAVNGIGSMDAVSAAMRKACNR